MKDIQALLNQYRDANENQRLHMYLQYRDLRSEFTAIGREVIRKKSRLPVLGKILEMTGCRRLHASCLKALRASHGGA